MHRLLLAAVPLLATPIPALAQDSPWSFEANLASEYISKGVGRSDGELHLAAAVQRRLAGQTYAGAWHGTLSSPLQADGETHLYVGWRPTVGDWRLDVRPMLKVLGGVEQVGKAEQWEFRIDAARPIGEGRLRLRAEYAPDGYGPAKGSVWAEALITHPIGAGWSAQAGVGRREQEVGRDYSGWNVGVQRPVGDTLTLDLRWIDTDAHEGGKEFRGRLVGGLIARF